MSSNFSRINIPLHFNIIDEPVMFLYNYALHVLYLGSLKWLHCSPCGV